MIVTESQRCDQGHRNGHITDNHESQSQYMTKKSADGHKDCGRQNA